jgi:tripartite motif-containing protein 71
MFLFMVEVKMKTIQLVVSRIGIFGILFVLVGCAGPLMTVAPTLPPTSFPVPSETGQPAQITWSITGEPNPFSRPIGVAIDSQGDVYVMDAGNSRVQKFDRNGKFLLIWGSKGNGDGQFDLSMPDEGTIALDNAGNVYVDDASNFRIQKFDAQGKFLAKWGSFGSSNGQFIEIADIAIDDQGHVYVSDYQNDTIQKFSTDGKFLLKWGSPGTDVGQFRGAGTIVIDAEGNVIVAEVERGRIQKFDPAGKPLSNFFLPHEAGIAIVPYAIALDNQGNMYISDNPAHRIVKLDSNLALLAVWGSKGTAIGQFMNMHTIRVDGEGNVYITDSANNCVLKLHQP